MTWRKIATATRPRHPKESGRRFHPTRVLLGWGLVAGLAIAGPPPALCDSSVPGPRLPTLVAGDPAENQVKFQFDLSLWVFATTGRESGFYAAYGQRGLWDVDNQQKPYRVENNFRPELGLALGPDAGRRLTRNWPASLSLSVAYVHESNGFEGDLSRGWNRAIGSLRLGSTDSTFRASLRGWYAFRVEETNADLTHYAGVGELGLVARLSPLLGGHLERSSLRLRSAFSPDAPHARFFTNIEAGLYLWPGFLPHWIFPGADGPPIDFVLEWFVGYGEFLVDYSESTNQIRLGIALRSL